MAVYRDGWTASGMLAVVGRDAEAKARAAGAIVLERVRRAGVQLADSLVECLGAGDVAPGVVRAGGAPFEVVLRVTVRDPDRAAVERFCRELAPLVTSGPPGIAGYAAGRPSPRPAFGYWPALCPRPGRGSQLASRSGRPPNGPRRPRRSPAIVHHLSITGATDNARTTRWIRLGDLAHTRSGDKGNRSNIGVVANDAAAYAWLETHLTEAAVADFLRPLGIGAGRGVTSSGFMRSTS